MRNRRCRWCSRTAPEAELVRVGTTTTSPGWCGGPRQGGRGVFMHAECITAAEEADRASRERHDAELAELRLELQRGRGDGDG